MLLDEEHADPVVGGGTHRERAGDARRAARDRARARRRAAAAVRPASVRASVSICCSPAREQPGAPPEQRLELREQAHGRRPRRRGSASGWPTCVRPAMTTRSSGTKPSPRRTSAVQRHAGGPAEHAHVAARAASSSPASVSKVVVFPAPFGPSSATTSPGRHRRGRGRAPPRGRRSRPRARGPPRAARRSTARSPRQPVARCSCARRATGSPRYAATTRGSWRISSGVPVGEVTPSSSTVTRSQTRSTSATSCSTMQHRDAPLVGEVADEAAELLRSPGRRGRPRARRAAAPTDPPRRRARSPRGDGGRTAARRAGGRGRPRARTRGSPRSAAGERRSSPGYTRPVR